MYSEEYADGNVREVRGFRIKESTRNTYIRKASRFAAACKCDSVLWIRPSSDTRATKGFAYSDRYAYVGELESSDPPARYDLLFPHFIDPPFYTNKLAVPPRLPTPKESYSDATGHSPLFPFVGFGNR